VTQQWWNIGYCYIFNAVAFSGLWIPHRWCSAATAATICAIVLKMASFQLRIFCLVGVFFTFCSNNIIRQ
jgi:hypothetical protein